MSHWLFDEPALESELAPAMEADIGKAMEIAKAGAEKLKAVDAKIASLMSDRSEILPIEMTVYEEAVDTVAGILHELRPCAKLNPSIWRAAPIIGAALGTLVGIAVGTKMKDVAKKVTTLINGEVCDTGTLLGATGGGMVGATIGDLIKKRMDKIGVERDTKYSNLDLEPKHTAAYISKVNKPFEEYTDHEARNLIQAIMDDLEIKQNYYSSLDNSFGKAARIKFTSDPSERKLSFSFN